MTKLETMTLASIAALCNATFRMGSVIVAIIEDLGGDAAPPDSVRHWKMLSDACLHLIDCMEKTAEVETNRALAEEAAEWLQVMERSMDRESAKANETVDFLRKHALPPDWPVG